MIEQLAHRAVNSACLDERLGFNEKYSTSDFHDWLFGILNSVHFRSALDAACGTGKITAWLARKINGRGHLCAFDISKDSIAKTKEALEGVSDAEVTVGNFDEFESTVKSSFTSSFFDLIHCSFALYYAINPVETMYQMKNSLSDNGHIVISGPHRTNTLLNFLSIYHEIPQLSWDCLEFINDVVLNFANRNFNNVKAHVFMNTQVVTNSDDFANYYRSCTFYNEDAAQTVIKSVDKTIRETGSFIIQKSSKIVIASNLDK